MADGDLPPLCFQLLDCLFLILPLTSLFYNFSCTKQLWYVAQVKKKKHKTRIFIFRWTQLSEKPNPEIQLLHVPPCPKHQKSRLQLSIAHRYESESLDPATNNTNMKAERRTKPSYHQRWQRLTVAKIKSQQNSQDNQSKAQHDHERRSTGVHPLYLTPDDLCGIKWSFDLIGVLPDWQQSLKGVWGGGQIG